MKILYSNKLICSFLGPSLIESVQMTVNGKNVSRNSQGYAFKHFLQTTTGSFESKRSVDWSVSGFYEDAAGMENVVKSLQNPSFIQRMNRHKEDKTGNYTMLPRRYCFRLHHDLSEILSGSLPPSCEASVIS